MGGLVNDIHNQQFLEIRIIKLYLCPVSREHLKFENEINKLTMLNKICLINKYAKQKLVF